MVDNAMVGCRALLQDTAPLFIITTYPVLDLLVSLSPAQSASENADASPGGGE